MFDLEKQIIDWKVFLIDKGKIADDHLLEMENHLRDEIEDLMAAGLSEEEAFLISVKRFGNIHELSKEYKKVNTDQLWKQLLLNPEGTIEKDDNKRLIGLVVLFSVLSGSLMKLPEWFGLSVASDELFYLKNISFFILPFVGLFFLLKNRIENKRIWGLLALYALLVFPVNLYPFTAPGDTAFLTALHLPLFFWLVTGIFYMGDEWRSRRERMNFVRFTGEAFIYGTLIACGLIVLAVFVMAIFQAINIDAEFFVENVLIYYGMTGAVMITVFLVETKKSMVENFAPVLAKIFSPFFLLTIVIFLIAMIVTGTSPFVDRDFLIAFDFMLMMVLALVLYVISSRKSEDKVSLFDYLSLALILVALLIDGIALSAITFRLSAYGITPNKMAALGANIAMLINLLGLAFYYIRFILKKSSFEQLVKFQTVYLNIYFLWFGFVAFVFPILFNFA
ncbi:permease prefix domain 1-containing protein [Eubacteriaceae bacterium ES3]|nr:permease prefix domain 1-containing protein [Eubacteriaceae bacterium ES3]